MYFFLLLPTVSAASYSVDSSWSNGMIQDLIDNTANITELYFSSSSGNVFNGVSLVIDKSLNVFCDVDVVFNGSSKFIPLK